MSRPAGRRGRQVYANRPIHAATLFPLKSLVQMYTAKGVG
jgi:hypothetical protein